MIYLAPDTSRLRGATTELGVMLNFKRSISPALSQGRVWALDNGCFTRDFDENGFFGFLEKLEPYRKTGLFIVAPDKVGEAEQTQRLWRSWSDRFKETGYPVAFVAQDGQDAANIPKTEVLFIGGTTAWKMSKEVIDLILEAKSAGMWVHIGRVNTWRRMQQFSDLADSVDGTCFLFDPSRPLSKWAEEAKKQASFFGLTP